MAQTRNRVWVEVIAVVMTLAVGGVLLYTLLPFVTTPDQVVVPPPQKMDVSQTLLTWFIVATAVGAPLTAGIVLALVLKFVSKRVPASSTVAPDLPVVKPKSKTTEPVTDLSPREALLWKIAATVLVLIVAALGLVWVVSSFMQTYGLK